MKRLAFSDPMMRALAAGEKTMTRRPVREACLPTTHPRLVYLGDDGLLHHECDRDLANHASTVSNYVAGAIRPRFAVGNLVAATCAFRRVFEATSRDWSLWSSVPIYRFNSTAGGKWETARVMTAALAPYVLRITDVRAERLGDITEADALREGALVWAAEHPEITAQTAGAAFREIWRWLYGDGAWERDASSWVWVYGFEVAEARV